MIAEIDVLVHSSLTTLAEDLSAGWMGRREREVVSLFCFGHLLRHCRPGTFLHDPAQIAIEVAVPQISGQTSLTDKPISKNQVCKDIVIWPGPRMTCWDSAGAPTVRPSSILEWKHNESDVSGYDVRWLEEFSASNDDFIGYAVCTNSIAQDFSLSCTRVHRHRVHSRWLFIR
jgi:hypothetical protein